MNDGMWSKGRPRTREGGGRNRSGSTECGGRIDQELLREGGGRIDQELLREGGGKNRPGTSGVR